MSKASIKKQKEEELAKREADPSYQRDKRTMPAVKKLFDIIAAQDVIALGDTTEQAEVDKFLEPVYMGLVSYLVETGFRTADIKFLFRVAIGVIDQVQSQIGGGLGINRRMAEQKLWGIADLDELTVKMVHEKAAEGFKDDQAMCDATEKATRAEVDEMSA